MNTKILLGLVMWFFAFTTVIGQISISNDGSAPDPSAMLHVKSQSKGFLAPVLSSSQRDLIANPAEGLLIYVTNDSSFYYYSGTMWLPMQSSAYRDWTKNGTDLYSAVSGNIGIGTSSPTSKLEISTPSNSIKLGTGNEAIFATHYSSNTYGYIGGTHTGGFGYSPTYIGLRGTTDSGYGVYGSASGSGYSGYFVGKTYIGDKLGIGTTSITDLLTIKSAGNTFISVERNTNQDGGISWLETGTTQPQWIFPYFRGWQSDNLIIRDEVLNQDVMTFEFSTADVGIGISNPVVPLHIDGGIDATLSSGGYFQINESSSSNLVFDDNEIMARNNGTASFLLLNKNGGNVGVGTGSPSHKLTVNGSLHAEGAITTGQKTGIISIPAAAFNPGHSTSSFFNDGEILYNFSNTGKGFLTALYFPDSVLLDAFQFSYIDSSLTQNLTLKLVEYDPTTGTSSVVKALTSGSTGLDISIKTHSEFISPQHLIENDQYAYYLSIWMSPSTTTDVLKLSGAKISYKYTRMKL